MTIDINVQVEDIDDKILEGYTQIELHRATVVSGPYTLLTQTNLIADTVYYVLEDNTGTVNNWYQYRFTGVGGGAPTSAFSNPQQPSGVSRLRIRQKAIEEYKAGAVFSSAAGGSDSLILTNDYRFKSNFFYANRGAGSWTYPTTGTKAGEGRMVTATSPSAGSFTVNPVMSGSLAQGDQFEWHWITTPHDWDLAINRALARYVYIERVPIVGDDSGFQSLDFLPWLKSRKTVLGLWWFENSEDQMDTPFGTLGRWWEIRQDREHLSLVTNPRLETTQTVYLEAERTLDPLFTDASVAPAVCSLRLIAALAYDEVLRDLIAPRVGSSPETRALFFQQRVQHQQIIRKMAWEDIGQARLQPQQYSETPRVPMPWRAR